MYNKLQGGKTEEVQGIKCCIPPVGYGVNRLTGNVEYIGVHKRSAKKADQFWERFKLPEDYDKKREAEERQMKTDPDYFDADLEGVRNQHWLYRLCGHWFMNNGEPTYITGTHWFYLNWCSTTMGYLDYRDNDRKLFYVLAHAEESPVCGGVVYIGRRQCGKTYISAAWMLDKMTLVKRKMGAIQSKSDIDSTKVFAKIVNYFVDLPHFFRPVYDTSKGLRPQSELKFYKATIRGKDSERLLQGEELRSSIEPGNSKSSFFDGQDNMVAYILDEFGKPQNNDVWETWQVVKPCIFKEGRWFGSAFVCSTIEDMDVTGEAPKKIWDYSDQNHLNANGLTTSGLYRIFFGAHESTFYNKYGIAEIGKATTFYNNERESLRGKSRELSSVIRKNPFTIQEAFRIDGEKCIYDSMLINDRLDALAPFDNIRQRGNFVWENGVEDTKVIWQKNKNGRFSLCWNFPTREDGSNGSNGIIQRGQSFFPTNTMNFVAACDPFSHSKTQDEIRRSKAAACFKSKYDPKRADDPYNDSIICVYHARPDNINIFHEDMIKACVYFGCQILFENNKNNWEAYFIARGYEAFLIKLPGNNGYGIHGNDQTAQRLCDLTELQISENIDKQHFPEVLNQWLLFDFANRTPSDLAMASGYVFIADDRWSVKAPVTKSIDVSRLFKQHKISA